MARALVTGAGKRIGRELALGLARRGYDVAVHYAGSAEAAEETVSDIQALGQKGICVQADLTREAETQALFPSVTEALGGPVTVLVNNASVFEPDDIGCGTRESWDRHMESNLRAPLVLMQAMAAQGLEAVRDAGGEPVAAGLVMNMIDQRVRKLTPEFMSYTLSKAALWTLTQTAAQALAPHIRVNAIGPGPTLPGPRQTSEDFATQRGATVLGRGVFPEDIMAALGYFLDAKGVTGQLLCVDGGQHLGWQTPDVLGVE